MTEDRGSNETRATEPPAPVGPGAGRAAQTARRLRRRRALRALWAGLAIAAVAVPLVAGQLRTRDAVEAPGGFAAEPPQPLAEPVPPPEERDPTVNIVAQATGGAVEVFDAPDAPAPSRRLSNPTEVGAPLVFLVDREEGDWLEVLLPVRPNGSSGWIRREDVSLVQHRYRMEVRLGDFRLEVWNGEERVLHADIAVGTQDTPTPGGRFYIKELLQPPNPDSVYGTYAYGLSGFSNVLKKFNGGNGVIGVHGTNDPSVIGSNVSAGCIRMTNEDIEKLVPLLPLGTPVEILA